MSVQSIDTELAGKLRELVDEQGVRWRARTNEREGSTYTAGVLHGLCIALAVATADDSDALLHEQMSGRERRERLVGEVRVVKIGGTAWDRDRFAVETWDGAAWVRVSPKSEGTAA